jgi:hypothetical protein
MRLRAEIQLIIDECECVELKITFLLDASGHLLVLCTDYDV